MIIFLALPFYFSEMGDKKETPIYQSVNSEVLYLEGLVMQEELFECEFRPEYPTLCIMMA